MKHASLISCLILAATSSSFAQDAKIISANATLNDGSTIKGVLSTDQITGSTVFAERIDLAPELLKTVSFANTNGESKIELANGDKFTMKVANENFTLKSLLSELNIPRANFRSIALSTRKALAADVKMGLSFTAPSTTKRRWQHPPSAPQ